MSERKFRNILIGISIMFILSWIGLISYQNNSYIKKFKNGELTLICHFKSGYKKVILEGFDDETGYFWGNGWSAKNCKVIIENK